MSPLQAGILTLIRSAVPKQRRSQPGIQKKTHEQPGNDPTRVCLRPQTKKRKSHQCSRAATMFTHSSYSRCASSRRTLKHMTSLIFLGYKDPFISASKQATLLLLFIVLMMFSQYILTVGISKGAFEVTTYGAFLDCECHWLWAVVEHHPCDGEGWTVVGICICFTSAFFLHFDISTWRGGWTGLLQYDAQHLANPITLTAKSWEIHSLSNSWLDTNDLNSPYINEHYLGRKWDCVCVCVYLNDELRSGHVELLEGQHTLMCGHVLQHHRQVDQVVPDRVFVLTRVDLLLQDLHCAHANKDVSLCLNWCHSFLFRYSTSCHIFMYFIL